MGGGRARGAGNRVEPSSGCVKLWVAPSGPPGSPATVLPGALTIFSLPSVPGHDGTLRRGPPRDCEDEKGVRGSHHQRRAHSVPSAQRGPGSIAAGGAGQRVPAVLPVTHVLPLPSPPPPPSPSLTPTPPARSADVDWEGPRAPGSNLLSPHPGSALPQGLALRTALSQTRTPKGPSPSALTFLWPC